MRVELNGSVVLVTGASSGIGSAMVECLGSRPKAVIMVARRQGRLDELAERMKILHPHVDYHVAPCDLRSRDQLETLVTEVEARFGGVDVLINNAGLGHIGFFEATPVSKVDDILEVNVLALSRLMRLLLPGMVARGHGGILNVSSSFGFFSLPFFSGYPATKAYTSVLTENVRCELAGTGVVVSQISPGPVHTEFLDVAGHPFSDIDLNQNWFSISAMRCARAGLRGFERGHAVITTDFLSRLAWVGGAVVPRFLVRWTTGLIMRYLRRTHGPRRDLSDH